MAKSKQPSKLEKKLPSYKIALWVNTSFIAFHRWKDAPDNRKYLRHFHRHTFNVKAFFTVQETNRELEFHDLRHVLDRILEEHFTGKRMEWSCEDIAIRIMDHLQKLEHKQCSAVTVDEDGECGATVQHLK